MRPRQELRQRKRLQSTLACFGRPSVADSDDLERLGFRRKKKASEEDKVLVDQAVSDTINPLEAERSAKVNPFVEMRRKFLLKKILKALFSRHHSKTPSAFQPDKKEKNKTTQIPAAPPIPSASPIIEIPPTAPPPSEDTSSAAVSPLCAAVRCIFSADPHEKKNNDQFLALSVLAMAMITIIFCGLPVAILCTSFWLCFLPRLRVVDTSMTTPDSPVLDLDSEEYKKRVVLEGLLQRNTRRNG